MKPELRPQSVTSIRPWLITLGTWLALVAVASSALWHLRSNAVNSQARELTLLSLALTDELEQRLQGAEEGLRAMQAELSEGRLPVSGPLAERDLRTRADLMPIVQTLWLVDSEGRAVSASDATPAPKLSSFSPAPDTLPDGGIAVSRPFIDAGAKEALVALAVRFSAGSSVNDGWILAALPAAKLLGAFSVASPAADARMLVFRGDGALLAGANVSPPTIDEATMAERLAVRPSMEVRRFRDGSENLVGLHNVPRYDLKVVVTRNLEAVLLPWRGAAELTAVAFALLLAFMAVSVHLVQRADRRRSEAQRALQAQRSRAGKLESLGTLAGCVAHDFNSVLAGIVGFGEMARDAAPAGSDQARHLDKVLRAALRGKSLVERILAFSRGGAHLSTVFVLEPIVDEVLNLLSASLPSGLILERALDAPEARLRGDATRLFEAVMNLCTNALQAMPGGGMLSVRLGRVHVAAPGILSHSQLPAGNFLALTVSDQGGGITPDVMEHLFEPFFTTRAAQSGTGLGLAVVFGVVTEFGGAIDVQSTPANGARFTLYFPECSDAVSSPASAPHDTPTGAGQALLVVDDEPELMALAVEMLKKMKYDPVGFTDSAAALQAVRDNPRRFAAVITDEVMPQLAGTQLTEALREFLPDLPVLLVSGYGGASLAHRSAVAGVTRVIAKPLQRADLARALAEVLR